MVQSACQTGPFAQSMDCSTRLKMKKAKILANNATSQRYDHKDTLTMALYNSNSYIFNSAVVDVSGCPCKVVPLSAGCVVDCSGGCVGGCFQPYCAMHQY